MSKKNKVCNALFVFTFISIVASCTSSSQAEMPKLIENNGRYALLVDGEPFFIFAKTEHSGRSAY